MQYCSTYHEWWQKGCLMMIWGKKSWHGGESTYLTPWPGCHIWVQFVVSFHPCLKNFSWVLWFSSLYKNQHAKFQFDQKQINSKYNVDKNWKDSWTSCKRPPKNVKHLWLDTGGRYFWQLPTIVISVTSRKVHGKVYAYRRQLLTTGGCPGRLDCIEISINKQTKILSKMVLNIIIYE